MTLHDKITKALLDTHAENIDKMLSYMERNGYFTCHCSSHNHWTGGSSQHMWAVYLIAKELRDQRTHEPAVAKYATDEKLTLICLLHDLCDMRVKVYDNKHKEITHHGPRSYWIMKNLNVGTEMERWVVRSHMHSSEERPCPSKNPDEEEEYNVLLGLVHKADHIAAGCAWNSTRFKEGRTQHEGVPSSSSHLRAVAMDRTIQSINKEMYMDMHYELRTFRSFYDVRDIRHFYHKEVKDILDAPHIPIVGGYDFITAAHEYAMKTGKRPCLVISANSTIPNDNDTRLRRGCINEQNILICSCLLSTLYNHRKCNEEDKKKKFRFMFTMKDEVKRLYREYGEKDGVLYLDGIRMIRDGESRGFPFVETWRADIMLVLGSRFEPFVVSR